MAPISANLEAIMARIRGAAERAGRDPASVTLVAVSKFQDLPRIREAAQAGLSHFAESRLQEAQTKLPGLLPLGEWHFIGSLQTNKAKAVAGLFEVIQSVDSLKLAEKLSAAALELSKTLRIYAQVNISRESQKHGFPPEGAEQEILGMGRLPGLKLEGLMGMAAASGDAGSARASFRSLRELRERLGGGLKLSMGMSQDFETAIEEGADLVRIGTALYA
jgi:pyridoxal phosphate enzyme (YggS family)